MYHKIKNTLAGLAVATSILGLSLSVGHPPLPSQDWAQHAGASETAGQDVAVEIDSQLDVLQAERRRNLGMRSQLSMPFFSFAPLLPRRES